MNEDLPRECPRLLFSMIKSSRQAVVDIVGAWMKAVADILIMDRPEEKKEEQPGVNEQAIGRVAVARGVDGGASFGKQPASHTLKARIFTVSCVSWLPPPVCRTVLGGCQRQMPINHNDSSEGTSGLVGNGRLEKVALRSFF